MQPTAHLAAPALLLDEAGHVSSADFGDVYFSRASGAEETRHVFLAGNGLPGRYAGRKHFTIGELGFGTGLNFHTAWQQFLAETDSSQHLHYISVEQFPLTREQFAALYPADEALVKMYPLRLPGWHRIHLERCTLTLGFGDAETLLKDADANIDAWFLDGFSPAKNPDMWGDGLLGEVARLTVPGGSFATFTAAGFVKRSLIAHGFTVEKTRGFAHKRDMLVGSKPGNTEERKVPQQVRVIGGGIAGCTIARALAERGISVALYEAGELANGASGNPAAALYPQLTKFYTPATQWHLTGYALMLRQLARWRAGGLDFTWEQPGMLRLLREGSAAALLESLRIDPAIAAHITQEEASALAGMEVVADGIAIPDGSWIVPGELCRALLRHPLITVHTNTPITVLPDDGTITCIATAQHAAEWVPNLPMGRSAGQISLVEPAGKLERIISHQGYIIPADGQWLVGATYDHDDFSGAVTEANHATNLEHLHEALPRATPGNIIGGRTSMRATTPDRLPYVGKVGEGLYVSVGHGSRGMISAPLAAEIIAAQIAGEMIPLTPALHAAIDPRRRR